jgi:hypothetical protein
MKTGKNIMKKLEELDDYSKSLLLEAYGLPRKFHYDMLALRKKQSKTFNEEEMDFIKRCIDVYWEHYANSSHEDNLDDWNISQNILKK